MIKEFLTWYHRIYLQNFDFLASFAILLEFKGSKDRKAYGREINIALPALKPVNHLPYAGLPENRQLKETNGPTESVDRKAWNESPLKGYKAFDEDTRCIALPRLKPPIYLHYAGLPQE